jgi:cytosine/adenosine deaminase-related metal-dependent hydrolase
VIGLHASFTVSDETIRKAGQLCEELGTVLQIHLAEDGADVRDARERGYAGPLQRLMALDALPAGSILVHGVHLSADEVVRASEAGCWFVQNARSNRKNCVGYPLRLAGAARVALGTDGFPSNMPDEAAALAETSAAAGEPPDAIGGRLDAGWTLAAERLGISRERLAANAGAPPSASDIGAIEEDAREQASHLWARW